MTHNHDRFKAIVSSSHPFFLSFFISIFYLHIAGVYD